jgi:hypothetical protein
MDRRLVYKFDPNHGSRAWIPYHICIIHHTSSHPIVRILHDFKLSSHMISRKAYTCINNTPHYLLFVTFHLATMPTESVQRTHILKKYPSYASLTQENLSILQPYSTHPSRHIIFPFEPLSCVSYQCIPYHTPSSIHYV